IGPMLNSSGYTVEPPDPEHLEDHQGDADVNGGVGHIESPEVPASTIEIEEVEHIAIHDAIDQVADRAADNERQSHPGEALLGREHRHIDGQTDERSRLQ